MAQAGHSCSSLGPTDANAELGAKALEEKIGALVGSIAELLSAEPHQQHAWLEYRGFGHAAELAFAADSVSRSRFAGPIGRTNRLISDVLSLVAASSDAAAALLELAPSLLPYVAGASPTVAWGLVDVVETALWCIDEPEFSLLRGSRLLLLSHMRLRHSVLHAQHALAMALYMAPLGDLSVRDLENSEVPLVVQLLVLMGQRDEDHSRDRDLEPSGKAREDIEQLYWADCDYVRLAVNAVFGLRVPTLMKMVDGPRIGIKDLWRGVGQSITSRVNTCELVALVLMSKCDAARGIDLGVCATRLHTLLSTATTEFGQIDGPALALKNQLKIIVDSTVWLLALQGLPPPLRDNQSVRQVMRLGCVSAVTILCEGTRVFEPHICVGACLLLRSYARSVHALRTEQIVSADKTDALCAALKRLLIEDPEHGVDEAVAGLLCNLLIDFSRLREPLISIGIIPVLCDALQRNRSRSMLVSTLWALRNVCALRDAIEVEQLSFRSLDRVGALKPLLTNEDREVTRLFCALLGNVSPANLGELYRLLGGRKVIVQYLTRRIEYWEWQVVQEAASQALANLMAAIAFEDVDADAETDADVDADTGADSLMRDLCQGIVRCLKHPGASQTLLANVGYMITNSLLLPDHDAALASKLGGARREPAERRVLGSLMMQEGVYEALTQIDSPMLSVRNSLVSARNALKVTADAGAV